MEQTINRGLDGVNIDTSSICFIDGGRGELIYRGYDIRELADRASFEEVVHLLWEDDLPSRHQLESLRSDLSRSFGVPPQVYDLLKALPRSADPMHAVTAAVALLGALDPNGDDVGVEGGDRRGVPDVGVGEVDHRTVDAVRVVEQVQQLVGRGEEQLAGDAVDPGAAVVGVEHQGVDHGPGRGGLHRRAVRRSRPGRAAGGRRRGGRGIGADSVVSPEDETGDRWSHRLLAPFLIDHVELAEVANCPVINALSDDEHPCQVYADFLTLKEKGLAWSDIRLAYLGDGNNVCVSLMLMSGILGSDFRIACPKKYWPAQHYIDEFNTLAAQSGARLTVTEIISEAVSGANAVYTDIWASMGWEKEAAERSSIFRPYQLNAAVMAQAEKGAFVMHDLPAHRGEEITDEVMDGPNSIVFDQAENRLHAQKSLILECMGLSD